MVGWFLFTIKTYIQFLQTKVGRIAVVNTIIKTVNWSCLNYQVPTGHVGRLARGGVLGRCAAAQSRRDRFERRLDGRGRPGYDRSLRRRWSAKELTEKGLAASGGLRARRRRDLQWGRRRRRHAAGSGILTQVQSLPYLSADVGIGPGDGHGDESLNEWSLLIAAAAASSSSLTSQGGG